ncbi:MAG: cbb3-type cytochrome c oxidase subunit I, partial [Hyphomicrobiaceae bacterium]|nr:cbb3-type cytochrome c oxidase subunit I [Hyphomicrobiaceae bacterium]
MAQAKAKYMTLEEGGFAALFLLSAFAFVILAGKATDPVMSFHAVILTIGAALGLFLTLKNYFGRDAGPVPQEIDGKPNYNLGPVKFATAAAMFWGIAGFLVGVIIASQLAWPALNFDLPWTNFSRLRPLHTSAVIFAFGGNVLLGTSFYVVQRTSRARLPGRIAPWVVILGYNLFIVVAGTGYLLGATQGREYAEPEWYADLYLTVIWVIYLLTFLGTLWKRKEPHIYVA